MSPLVGALAAHETEAFLLSVLVIMALVTTLMTAPIVRRLLVGMKLEAGP